jgi:hypothetical protein
MQTAAASVPRTNRRRQQLKLHGASDIERKPAPDTPKGAAR